MREVIRHAEQYAELVGLSTLVDPTEEAEVPSGVPDEIDGKA